MDLFFVPLTVQLVMYIDDDESGVSESAQPQYDHQIGDDPTDIILMPTPTEIAAMHAALNLDLHVPPLDSHKKSFIARHKRSLPRHLHNGQVPREVALDILWEVSKRGDRRTEELHPRAMTAYDAHYTHYAQRVREQQVYPQGSTLILPAMRIGWELQTPEERLSWHIVLLKE